MKFLLVFLIFTIPPAFAEPIELLVSPLIGESFQPGNHQEFFIIRDTKNSMTWELAHPEIAGLDYVEGNSYLILAEKSFTMTEHQKYDLVEVLKIFKSHKPYKSLCAPGYHTWVDGNCIFAFRCSEFAYPGKPCTTNWTKQDYLRPLQQQKAGVLPQDVICLESLQLVINHNSSACIKPSSVDRFMELGYTLGDSNDSPYTSVSTR